MNKKSKKHRVISPDSSRIATNNRIEEALKLHQNGDIEAAAIGYKAILKVAPNNFDALHLLSLCYLQKENFPEALTLVNKALEINSNCAEAYCNRGVMLVNIGRFEEAEKSYLQAIKIKADYAQPHTNLGNLLQQIGRLTEAKASCVQALKINPNLLDTYINLGVTCHKLDQLQEAEASYRRCIALYPNYAKAYCNLGNVLVDLGQLVEAESCYRKAISLNPDYADAYIILSGFLIKMGKLDESEENCKRAMALNPSSAEVHLYLGIIYSSRGQAHEALLCLQYALKIKPHFAEAYCNLGNALIALGRCDEAFTAYRLALKYRPNYQIAYSNLLLELAYSHSIPSIDYLTEAKQWELQVIPQNLLSSAKLRSFNNTERSRRRLRVGYVSGDFVEHAVSFFIIHIFEHHNRERIELFAYATKIPTDLDKYQQLATMADHNCSLVGMSDSEARDRIEADQIDVLIDLSGHTGGNRLGVFALRAAPVQAHYLGYFASTGIASMDYWIGDSVILPESAEADFCETIWRLPQVWVSYRKIANLPTIQWRPKEDGTLWLGSFNNLKKINLDTLSLWAKILHALPEGRLLLKTKLLNDIANKTRIEQTMKSYGINSERLLLLGGSSGWFNHMAYYDQIDIALDSINGIGGGTTTCDALVMGVPVITLSGNTKGQRMTASMLNAIGHPEWIAKSERDYIQKVVGLARNVEHRSVLRVNQRAKVFQSPLCDGALNAKSLEDAYEAMFDVWFNKQSTAQDATPCPPSTHE